MCFNQVWESEEIPYYKILELFLFLYKFILLLNHPISLLKRDGIQGGSPLYMASMKVYEVYEVNEVYGLNEGKDWPSLG